MQKILSRIKTYSYRVNLYTLFIPIELKYYFFLLLFYYFIKNKVIIEASANRVYLSLRRGHRLQPRL